MSEGGLTTELEVCDEMLDGPALPAARLNEELVVRVFFPSDLKTSVGCFVSDCLALGRFDKEVQQIV